MLSAPGSTPLVSVVIPCYNQARFLGDAIRSVHQQTCRDVEVIVVNDGSTDETAEVAAQFPDVRVITQDNRGLSAARNAGLAHSRGELIVFLDADDRLLPGAIETGAALLRADRGLAFAAGYSRFIAADGTPLPTEQPVRTADHPYRALMRRNSIRNPAMVMFRRAAIEETGGFDATVDACADYEIYLRLSRRHPVRLHEAVVAEYRKHGTNMSLDAALMLRQLCIVLRRQRPHLTDPETRRAHHDGVRNVQRYYGDRLATQIRLRIRTRSGWLGMLRDVAALLRWHPRGAFEHALRKGSVWRRGLRARASGAGSPAVSDHPQALTADVNSPPGTPSSARRRTPIRTPAESRASQSPGIPPSTEPTLGDRTGRE